MKRKSSKQFINKWTVLGLALLVFIVIGTVYAYKQTQTTKEQNVLETSTIDTGDIILTATGLGTLIPNQEVSIGFKNGGRVSDVSVNLGNQVRAGDVLAKLDSKTLELEYKQAAGNLAALSSPAEIAAAEQAVQDAKDSLATAKDDLQYMIGPEMLIAETGVADAQTALEKAKAAAEKDPSEGNKQKVSEAEAALTKAKETLDYAFYNYSNSYTLQTFTFPIRNDKGTTVRRDLIAPTEAELSAARAAYELAQANLKDAQNYLDVLYGTQTTDEVPASSLTSMTEANLAFDQAKAGLDATKLTAPISGTITSISLNIGENVGTSAVITIANMDQPYTLDAYLDETDWDKAKVGYAASVTFDLLPDDNYPAKVTQVYPILDDSSGTAMVHILVQLDETIPADLPVGSTASVDVTGGEALGVVLVPVSALKEVETGKYIVYIVKNGEPAEQAVEIGLQDILFAEVKSGLQRGDVVLTDATAVNQ